MSIGTASVGLNKVPTLPPIWNVPHLRNPNFTGRETLLVDLRAALMDGQPGSLINAIHGLGGVGKTALVVEYIYRYAKEYGVVWWLRAGESATLAADYADLARELDLPQKDASDQQVVVDAVRRWLGQTGPVWLLVFDNARGPIEIRDYIPQGPTGHVLIASTNPNWGGIANPISVRVFDRVDSLDFLLKRTKHTDKDVAVELAKALGDLPLALEQAGAYVESTGITLAAYLDLFKHRRIELWGEEHHPLDYTETVSTTWNLAMEQIRKESPASGDLLNLCSYLGPDSIPLALFSGNEDQIPKSLLTTVTDTLAMNSAISGLRRYSLIEATGDNISVHRLVQAVVRDRLADDRDEVWIEAALGLLNRAFQSKNAVARRWPDYSQLLSHALAVTEYSQELQLGHFPAAVLLDKVGQYLFERAEYDQAKSVLMQSLQTSTAAFGPNHAMVAHSLIALGRILKEMGDLNGARSHCERALAIYEASYESNHPLVSTAVNNLGAVLEWMGDLEGAKTQFERCLAIRENMYGRNHPEVAQVIDNLGYVLKEMGDFNGARSYCERALAIYEASYGSNHPEVGICVTNLGIVSQALGRLESARAHHERALAIMEEVYGPNHPNVANVLNNLAHVHYQLGDKEGARACFERSLQICKEFLGENHPHTVLVRDNLKSLGD